MLGWPGEYLLGDSLAHLLGKMLFRKVREASEPHRAGGGEADLRSPGMGDIARHAGGRKFFKGAGEVLSKSSQHSAHGREVGDKHLQLVLSLPHPGGTG